MTPEQIDHQIYMLRRNCDWQRSQGTKRDNGYPYGKHLPDCDICRSAELITQLQEQVLDITERLKDALHDKVMADAKHLGEIEQLQEQNANYKEQIKELVKQKYRGEE